MQVARGSRLVPRWLLVFAAVLIVAGNVCEFSGDAHDAAPASKHEREQSGETHHHGAAHLTTCEDGAVPTSSVYPFPPDVAMATPRLGRFVEPLHIRAVVVGRLPVSLSGPPLFLLHAALLI
jgi:hypothetical protein